MSKIMRNEDAFTGLEAAIVLIAFIVVAAVFSYVVLGAGFFTTQKSQEVVHTGVAQASSNMEVSGPVVIKADGDKVGSITFYLQLAAGGSPIDMNKVTYVVSTKNAQQTFTYDNIKENIEWYKDGKEIEDPVSNQLLEKFEFVKVTVTVDPTEVSIGQNNKFIVEIRPDQGAAYPLERNAPPSLENGHFYEVY